MKQIILDTNFLLIPGQFNVDIISEIRRICDFAYELCVIDKTLDELKTIAAEDKKQKNRQAAKLAQKLIAQHHVRILETPAGHADDRLVDLADSAIIATQDKGLKDRLKAKGHHIITMRQQQYIIFA